MWLTQLQCDAADTKSHKIGGRANVTKVRFLWTYSIHPAIILIKLIRQQVGKHVQSVISRYIQSPSLKDFEGTPSLSTSESDSC